MNQSEVLAFSSVQFDEETPYIETRLRVLHSPDGSLPEGKVMVQKTPILPPGATDEEIRARTTTEILDGDPLDDPFHRQDCENLRLGPHGGMEHIDPRSTRRRSGQVGRNDRRRCECGKKY